MKYDVILFDADDTLFDFDSAEEYSLEHASIDHKIPYDKNYHLKIYRDINDKIWEDLELGNITLEKLQTERFKLFLDKINFKFDEVKFADSYMNHLGDCSFVLDGAEDLLKDLYDKYKLVIVTNGITSIQNKRVRKSKIAKYFDYIIVSEEVNLSKPDKRIFEKALELIGYDDKSKVLMIGDSLTSDIKGGNNAGIDTCWFNPHHKINHTDSKPTYEVYSFKEIKNLI